MPGGRQLDWRGEGAALALLWLCGLYLRIPVLVAPPLAPYMAAELDLGQALEGALTTLPLLLFALGAMPGSLAISRLGPRAALALALLIMVLGSASRALMIGPLTLILTTAVMGLGIAVMQPALPALLPRWLSPGRIALGTAVYMNGMLVGEFIGAGITLPVLMPLFDDSWRATLVAWSLPALGLALVLRWPHQQQAASATPPPWIPDWRNPLTVRLGLVLGVSGSLFFGANAYMGSLLAQRGEADSLAFTLFWFNLAQVLASLVMLIGASRWVGRPGPIRLALAGSLGGTLGMLFTTGIWSLIFAVLMSFAAGVLLILLVALPPLLAPRGESGRLAAGTFMVGYTLAFALPLLGGALADWSGDSRHALALVVLYGLLVTPLAMRLPPSSARGRERPEH